MIEQSFVTFKFDFKDPPKTHKSSLTYQALFCPDFFLKNCLVTSNMRWTVALLDGLIILIEYNFGGVSRLPQHG